MYYGNIITCDIANGLGCRTSLFVSGCTRHCPGCFNPQTWDFQYGKPFTRKTMDYLLSTLHPSYIQGLTILGGEPLEQKNLPTVADIIRQVKEKLPEKDIWIYTGWTWKDLIERTDVKDTGLLSQIDVLVDGDFQENKKSVLLSYRGSQNQNVIDVPKTLAQPDPTIPQLLSYRSP